MAWSVTDRGTIQHSNSSADTTIPSFTPGASKLLLAWIAGYCNVTAVSGHGTWTHVGTVNQTFAAGGAANLRFYACKSSGSPSASAVTFTHAADFNRAAGCIEIDETVNGLPSAVADCFGTPVGMSAYVGSGTANSLGVTLGAFADANNLTVQVGVCDSGGDFTFVPEAGWAALVHEVGTAAIQGALSYKTTADTSPTMTGGSFANAGSISVEVKMAAGGGSSIAAISCRQLIQLINN